MRNFNTCALVLIFLATVTFSACEKVNKTQVYRTAKGNVHLGGTLRLVESERIQVLLPFNISSAIASRIGNQLQCGLLRLDPVTLKIVPGIAESWSVDNAGTTYVFKLRQGIKFHAAACFKNGSREITANDFVFTFKELCRPGAGKAFKTTFKGRVKGADAFRDGEAENLVGVEVIDDYTLKIELEKPDPSFLYVLAQPSTGVTTQKALDAFGSTKIVGAGPFMLVSNDSELLMVRNPDYFGTDAFGNHLPYLDTITVQVIDTKEKQLASFFAGDIDLVTHLYPDPVREILEQHVADFSGKNAKYVMQRESEAASYDVYSIFNKRVKGFSDNFMGYHDFSQVQLEN